MSEDNKKLLKEIGNRLRVSRESQGISRNTLAASAKMGFDKVKNLENGLMFPKGDDLLKICTALDVSPNHILTGSEEFKPNLAKSTTDDIKKLSDVVYLSLLIFGLDDTEKNTVEKVTRSFLSTKLTTEEYEETTKAANTVKSLFYGGLSAMLLDAFEKTPNKQMPDNADSILKSLADFVNTPPS